MLNDTAAVGGDWWMRYVVDPFPYSEMWLWALLLNGTHLIIFWSMVAFFEFAARRTFLDRWRIPRRAGMRLPPAALTREAFFDAALGSLVILPIASLVLWPLISMRGIRMAAPLPSPWVFARDLLVTLLLNDATFYWAHRLVHIPALYAPVHKRHHRFGASSAIATEFFTPADTVVNIIPQLVGPLLLGSHGAVLLLFSCLRVWQSVDTHCGFSLSFSPWNRGVFGDGARRHDFHHSDNAGCYGDFFPFWDWLCGTDAAFKRLLASEAAAKEKAKASK